MCMKRRKIGLANRLDEIVSYFSKDLIGARSGEMTKEDLEELIVILKRGMPKNSKTAPFCMSHLPIAPK